MRMSIAIAVGMILAGCAGSVPRPLEQNAAPSRPTESTPTVTSEVSTESGHYRYELLTPEQLALVQVFDDSRRTYLAFGASLPAGLLIFDEGGRAVPFTVGEHTAIVEGVHAGLLLRTPTKSSYAQAPRLGLMRVRTADKGEEETSWLPTELAAARAEILRAQARLTGISVELDRASQGESQATLAQLRLEIEEIQTVVDGVTATLLRAHFDSGSALLTLSAESKALLLDAAERADEVGVLTMSDRWRSIHVLRGNGPRVCDAC